MSLEADVKRFRLGYERAKKSRRKQFVFEGQPVLVSFAKYYLEYIEGVIKKQKEAVNG